MKEYLVNHVLGLFAIVLVFLLTPALGSNPIFAGEVIAIQNTVKVGFDLKNHGQNFMVTFGINSFYLTEKKLDGQTFQTIEIPGNFLPGDAGKPNLPGSGRYLAIPQGAKAKLNILSFTTDTIFNINLAPSFRIPKDNDTSPLDFSKDELVYTTDDYYPKEPFKLSEKDLIRGIDVVILGITPFQYNPVKKHLLVYSNIKVEVIIEGGNGQYGEKRYRNRWWDPILSDVLLNYSSLPKMDYDKNYSKDETGCEYLIITPNDPEFQIWADSIRVFRNKQGILTDIVSLNDIGSNSTDDIEAYIDNAYNTWDIPPIGCLILGDYGNNASNRVLSPSWNNYCVSDNKFGDVNGNDLPDIIMARMTARDELELSIIVSKFIEYERNPPEYADFYSHPITASGWQSDSWFQLTAEIVGGFWREALGKDPVRINEVFSGTPGDIWSTATNTDVLVNYFGPNGLGYIPELPSTLGGWTGGNASIISTAIDNGAFMIQHRDHGEELGWAQPEYMVNDINSLLNADLTFVWSTNCLTGKFNFGTEVFAEKMHRYSHKEENSGCFGINAASEITYAFVSDVFVLGAYDNMWPDFMPDFGTTPESRGVLPAFANVSAKYFLEQTNWPYIPDNKEATYHLFHHFGDAFTTVYSEIPQFLTVVHNNILYMGGTSFEVTADEDALIGLSVNGNLIGSATGEGPDNPVVINIPAQAPPDKVIVTVTKQNYYRYEATVDVLPASGPYVVYEAITLNDDSGNGNGLMETSESILAAITVKNVGVEDATNIQVILSSSDPNITITDDIENYGNISAGTTSVVPDAFSWDVSDEIPDMHVVEFELTITDGSLSWNSGFTIMGHAPTLESGTILIDDYIGNWNGRLDPGETAFMIIQTLNTGSFNAANTIGTLSTTSEYITLVNNTFNFYDIQPGSMEEGMFQVTVSEDAPAGSYVELIYQVSSGAYMHEQFYSTVISPLVEDWETGDMTQFPWETGGDANWDISTSNAYEGSYCVKSGEINDLQNSFLSIPFEALADDSISFWCRVSSETGYDLLKFYIDDAEQASWSGEVAWERASFLIPEGPHTLKWQYEKDETLLSGEDCAWIDFIIFPVFGMTAAFTSDVTEVCEGGYVSFFDDTPGGPISWEWNFEGGTPGVSAEQNPVIAYFNEGTYDVSLTVSDGSITNTLVMDDYVHVISSLIAPPPPTGDLSVCGNEVSTPYTTNGISGITEYSWVIEPEEAGIVIGTGLEVIVNWDISYLGDVNLKVAGINTCGEGEFSTEIMVSRYLPEVSLEPFETVCYDWPEFELSGGMPEGGIYSGPGVENGWFNPQSAGLGTHIITYTFTDTGNCENFAQETLLVDPCTGIGKKTFGMVALLYPNPSDGLLNLEFKQNAAQANIQVLNILNELIYSRSIEIKTSQLHSIDLSNQSEGIYFINIETQDKKERLKVIIK
ncbi:MAG: T9SS type A sorting domain-containing protein [Bacteroidales bacterium]|nr:T9SS type A sorting domain-containing protein [Bacteroidales bacterium]MCF8403412.1 T9SS type A sorting domain-containing protein [Bacteroidales bacterium]